ncbi:ELKS/Rab6-interacting/CAST family member 1-like [Apis dorsata]|uniref:ELKS/Rab6-interacting/CAST family member 1-like n=1 Tax=Apis dorsata TaxID=7462 RepID=UPI0003DF6E7A|nr:ELKS/Rab6-interacting/CAST family member 1-like [Apis dorsata]
MTELEAKVSSLETLSKEQSSCSPKRMKDAKNFSLEDNEQGWKKELETKNRRIAELEDQLMACKSAKNSDNVCTQSLKLMDEVKEGKESWRKEVRAKEDRILQLEDEMESLKRLIEEYKRSEENEARVRDDDKESWKLEVEAKNRRIVELEQEMDSLENFLREHADTESIRDMEMVIERKARRIEELEDTVAEFEDFLKQNPDVKELHDLRCQVTAGNRRIQELERWIQKNDENRESRIDRERVIELEEMVTQLEEYVREHNVDVLKRKLEDRECRIDQLQNRVGYLEKELLKVEEAHRGKETQIKKGNQEKEIRAEDSLSAQMVEKNFEKEQKMKKMEHVISEKDNKIQEYEQQILENKEETTKLRKEVASLKKELSEYDDIGVLKEEIRVRDEKIQQLEDEVDSLERAFSERIDLEQIEELVNVIKEKEDKERQLSKDLTEKRYKIEELGEALRESVVITSESERKLKNEEKLRQEALQRITKLEQRIASMQSASALKCITCQPLLSKVQKYEKKLKRLTEERIVQLEDLRQMKREALKAAVSEKDAHLALLELSGIKTAAQSEQADQLKADRKRLLEKLKKEDEKSIELSVVESNPTCSEGTPQLLIKVLETSDDDDEETKNDRRSDSSSSRPVTTNGNSCADSEKTSTESESRNDRERANNRSDKQDSR